MSMVFLLQKDKEGVYRVVPAQTKSIPIILCREPDKLVLLTPIPATRDEVEEYIAKHVTNETVETKAETETEVDVLDEDGQDDGDIMRE